jgi:predicted RNA binding protein YcfA (HicA-like mRNA interferase family)
MDGTKLLKSALILNSDILSGKVELPFHIPKKNMPIGTLKSIERQSGIKLS